LIVQRLEQRRRLRSTCHIGNPPVKREDAFHRGAHVTLVRLLLRLSGEETQPRKLRFRQALRRPADGQPFKGCPQRIKLFCLIAVVGSHEHAAPRVLDDPAFGFEYPQGITDGVLADGELLRQRQLDQPLAAQIVAGVDCLPQPLSNPFGARRGHDYPWRLSNGPSGRLCGCMVTRWLP